MLEAAPAPVPAPGPDDQALALLLAAAGSPYDPAGARALAAGAMAAACRAPGDWARLVAPDAAPDAAQALVRALVPALGPGGAPGAEPTPEERRSRLAAVRANLAAAGVDGFFVPRSDAHQNEYVPAAAERLAWLTGFTGSAGLAIVMADAAAIFVDGRYTLQAAAQVDDASFERCHLTEMPPETWLGMHLKPGQKLGYDPWLLTPDQVQRYAKAAEPAGATLVAVAENPVDRAWSDRPPSPLGPVMAYPVARAGRAAADKRREIALTLKRNGVAAAVLTAPDSIAWLLNLRGSDVPHTPLPLSFAILDDVGAVALFIDARKLLPGVVEALGPEVAIRAPQDLGDALDALGGRVVQADPATAAAWIFERLGAAGAILRHAADPTRLPRATKNPVELDGMRAAHRRDGVAMTRFLHWLDDNLGRDNLGGDNLGSGRNEPVREIEASDRLEAFRAEGEGFRDLSFDTISGAGPNGAIVHYRATPATERELAPGSFYLVDSGAQYLDGTTDITRTIAVGEPSPEMRDRYTRVLKGHIALARAVFPHGTPGPALDVLARQALWQAGLDYDHGTGHGVGHYLSVHEGPQRVHFQSREMQALLPGMVISDEPGFYRNGGYGIRTENLLAVVPVEIPGGERPMLGFEVLTLCPIDRRAIERTLMTQDEIAWLDAYHARVRATLLPLIEDVAAKAWLIEATEPL